MIGDEEIRDPSEEAAKIAGVFAHLSKGTASDRDWRGDRPPWSSSYLIRTLGAFGAFGLGPTRWASSKSLAQMHQLLATLATLVIGGLFPRHEVSARGAIEMPP